MENCIIILKVGGVKEILGQEVKKCRVKSGIYEGGQGVKVIGLKPTAKGLTDKNSNLCLEW